MFFLMNVLYFNPAIISVPNGSHDNKFKFVYVVACAKQSVLGPMFTKFPTPYIVTEPQWQRYFSCNRFAESLDMALYFRDRHLAP